MGDGCSVRGPQARRCRAGVVRPYAAGPTGDTGNTVAAAETRRTAVPGSQPQCGHTPRRRPRDPASASRSWFHPTQRRPHGDDGPGRIESRPGRGRRRERPLGYAAGSSIRNRTVGARSVKSRWGHQLPSQYPSGVSPSAGTNAPTRGPRRTVPGVGRSPQGLGPKAAESPSDALAWAGSRARRLRRADCRSAGLAELSDRRWQAERSDRLSQAGLRLAQQCGVQQTSVWQDVNHCGTVRQVIA